MSATAFLSQQISCTDSGFEVDSGVVVPDDDLADEGVPGDVFQDEFQSLSALPVQDDGRDAEDGRVVAPDRLQPEQARRVRRRPGLDQVEEAGVVLVLDCGGRFGDVAPGEFVFSEPFGRRKRFWGVEGSPGDEGDLEGQVAGEDEKDEGSAPPDRICLGHGGEKGVENYEGVAPRYERENVLRTASGRRDCRVSGAGRRR